MRAVILDAFDAAPVVRDDMHDPTAAPDGLVVRVRASSVNPVDNAIAAGMLRGMGRRGGLRQCAGIHPEQPLALKA